uniref:Protein kinase domain-containing protein n=1 Tax=Amorphochlora amoebiformis TaxID=1561963 RepID=A0A7S0CXT0_9EUKA|mmetsp:Transcript_15464/g.24487  ORF Transcript_15464/g.24487 Transcript_15464/m.24487 type:complete len:1212 (+) Transcript_15464:55-3690(+)
MFNPMFRVDTVDAVDTLDAPCKYTMQRSSSSYKKGTHCDVFDIDAKRWRTAQVLAKRRRQVLISYHGWDSKYDQWIDLPRIGQLWSKVKRGEYTGNSSSPLKAKIIAELDAVEVKSPYVEVESLKAKNSNLHDEVAFLASKNCELDKRLASLEMEKSNLQRHLKTLNLKLKSMTVEDPKQLCRRIVAFFRTVQKLNSEDYIRKLLRPLKDSHQALSSLSKTIESLCEKSSKKSLEAAAMDQELAESIDQVAMAIPKVRTKQVNRNQFIKIAETRDKLHSNRYQLAQRLSEEATLDADKLSQLVQACSETYLSGQHAYKSVRVLFDVLSQECAPPGEPKLQLETKSESESSAGLPDTKAARGVIDLSYKELGKCWEDFKLAMHADHKAAGRILGVSKRDLLDSTFNQSSSDALDPWLKTSLDIRRCSQALHSSLLQAQRHLRATVTYLIREIDEMWSKMSGTKSSLDFKVESLQSSIPARTASTKNLVKRIQKFLLEKKDCERIRKSVLPLLKEHKKLKSMVRETKADLEEMGGIDYDSEDEKEAKAKLGKLKSKLSTLNRDPTFSRDLARLRQLARWRPELYISRFKDHLDPLYGTAAAGLPVRSIADYEDDNQNPDLQSSGHSSKCLIAKLRFLPDKKSRYPCVLKLFDSTSSDGLRTFRRAVHVISRVRHRNIIQITGICRKDNNWLMEMPRYRTTLDKWAIQRRAEVKKNTEGLEGTESERWSHEVSRMLRGVLEGLDFLHQLGVIHRDLKPTNILIGPPLDQKDPPQPNKNENYAVIADFETSKWRDVAKAGLAKTTVRTTVRHVWTEGYRDPEIYRGVKAASDMYAFGVVMGELLIGKRLQGPEDVEDEVSKGQLEPDQARILSSVLEHCQEKRMTAFQALQSPFFSHGPSMKRTCCVCWDDRPLSEGVECFPTSAEGKAHFHCNKCFDRLVKVQAQDCAQIKRNGKIFCSVCPQGASPPYSQSTIASTVRSATYRVYSEALSQLERRKIKIQLQPEISLKIKVEAERLRKWDELKRKAYDKAQFIYQNILPIIGEVKKPDCLVNLCPSCRTPFQHFTACFALTCAYCQVNFCAWCLQICDGPDPHRHVRECKESLAPGQVFSSVSKFHQSNARRRTNQLRKYLRGLEPPIRKRVLKDERKDLSSLGFQHVLDDFANPDDDAHHRRRDHHNNQTTINVSAELQALEAYRAVNGNQWNGLYEEAEVI